MAADATAAAAAAIVVGVVDVDRATVNEQTAAQQLNPATPTPRDADAAARRRPRECVPLIGRP